MYIPVIEEKSKGVIDSVKKVFSKTRLVTTPLPTFEKGHKSISLRKDLYSDYEFEKFFSVPPNRFNFLKDIKETQDTSLLNTEEDHVSSDSDNNAKNLGWQNQKYVKFEMPENINSKQEKQQKSILYSEAIFADDQNYEAILTPLPLSSKKENESKQEQKFSLKQAPISSIKHPNYLKQKNLEQENQEKSILISEISLKDTKPLLIESKEYATLNKLIQNLNSSLDSLPSPENESKISKESNQKQDKISQIKQPPPPPILASQSKESFLDELQKKIKSRKSFETESFQKAEKSQTAQISENKLECILKKSIDYFKFDENEIDENDDEKMKEFEENVPQVERKNDNYPVIRFNKLSK